MDFKSLYNKNKKFYEGNKENDFYYKIPADNYIENDIENKIVKDFKINILSKKYNVSVSDREIYDEIKKYVEEFKTKENLIAFLEKRYSVDLNFFQEKYIKSYILMHKLDSFIKNDEKINKDAFKKISLAETKLKDETALFYKVANEYNTDNLKESGGSIGWIEKNKLLKSFPELEGVELKKGLITNVLRDQNGYYIIKIEGLDASDANDLFVKASVIKVPTMNLNTYLQKQFNNIRIKEYTK